MKSSALSLFLVVIIFVGPFVALSSLVAGGGPPYSSSGSPVNGIPSGTYWGFQIGNYTSYLDSPLPPGNYKAVFNQSVTLYLLISPKPFLWSQCSAGACPSDVIPQGASAFVSTNGYIDFVLNQSEFVTLLATSPNLLFTVSRNSLPLSVTAVYSAPNQTNSCGYNGYPYGYQGCGPIYTALWLTDGSNYYYFAAISCAGFGSNPYQGETAIPLGAANTCSGTQIGPVTLQNNYNLTFTVSGLPQSASWGVEIGGSTYTTTSNSLTITLPMGNYTYTVIPPSGYSASPSSGQITLTGNTVVQITLSAVVYQVIFTESGLPPGTPWSVTLAGVTKYSTSSTITFNVVDGTYSYTIGAVAGYAASPQSGTITVNGSNVESTIVFSATLLYVLGIQVPSQPIEGSQFSVIVTFENPTNSTLKTPQLTANPISPSRDSSGQPPIMSCSPPNPAAIGPHSQVSVVYDCLARWNIVSPPSLSQFLIQSYVDLALTAAKSVATSGGLVSYAQTHLGAQQYKLLKLGMQAAGVTIGAVQNLRDIETIVFIVELVSGNQVTMGVEYGLSFSPNIVYTPQSQLNITVRAPPSKFKELYSWAAAQIGSISISLALATAGFATLPGCATVYGCIVPGALFAAAALIGPLTSVLFQHALTDPNPNYTLLVTLPPPPAALTALPNNTFSKLVYYEYEYIVN